MGADPILTSNIETDMNAPKPHLTEAPPSVADTDPISPSARSDTSTKQDRKKKRRITPSILVAVALALGATAWITSGNLPSELAEKLEVQSTDASDNRAQTSAAPPAATNSIAAAQDSAVPTVRIYQSQERARQTLIRIAGRTAPSREGRLMAEVAGAVENLSIEEGDELSAGQKIASLEIQDRRALVRSAEALVTQREIEYRAAAQLASKGFQSEIRRAQAEADLETARATLNSTRQDLAKTQITAPFDGVVVETGIELGDFVQVGDIIATVADMDPLLVVADVSEREVARIAEGGLATAQLITGEVIEGIVSYISPRANDQTRTFRVEIEVPDTQNRYKAGVTAELLIPTEENRAHLISPALLTLNDAGDVGVKILDNDNRVQFIPVLIIEDTPRGLWVRGLPSVVTIISVGQEYVRDGEIVTGQQSDILNPN